MGSPYLYIIDMVMGITVSVYHRYGDGGHNINVNFVTESPNLHSYGDPRSQKSWVPVFTWHCSPQCSWWGLVLAKTHPAQWVTLQKTIFKGCVIHSLIVLNMRQIIPNLTLFLKNLTSLNLTLPNFCIHAGMHSKSMEHTKWKKDK